MLKFIILTAAASIIGAIIGYLKPHWIIPDFWDRLNRRKP